MKIDERLIRKFGKIFSKGSYVFREGESSNEIYYMVSGCVQIIKQAGQGTKVLAEMGPGDYFGEMAALINAPRTASAYVTKDSHIAVIHGETFRRLLRESGDVSVTMLKELSHRLKKTNQALEESTQVRVKLTIILYLLKEWPFDPARNPIQELASLTGMEPGEVQDVFYELADQGILEIRNGIIADFYRDPVWHIVFG